jgi:chromosome segregation ATPase
MKTKIVATLLALACAGLLIAMLVVKNQSDEQHKNDRASIDELTKQVGDVTQTNIEIKEVNLELNRELTNSHEQVAALSNDLATAAVTLADSRTQLTNAQYQISGLNMHINDLEQQNKALDQRAADLTNAIAQLNLQIADTRTKLASTENNNTYLQQELQKQMAEKAELEHKFNDLDALRQQVKKIKTDHYVARRLQLMKNDTSGKKGAELLISRQAPAPSAPAGSDAGLNVEVGSDGSVRVIPPMGATNSAAH